MAKRSQEINRRVVWEANSWTAMNIECDWNRIKYKSRCTSKEHIPMNSSGSRQNTSEALANFVVSNTKVFSDSDLTGNNYGHVFFLRSSKSIYYFEDVLFFKLMIFKCSFHKTMPQSCAFIYLYEILYVLTISINLYLYKYKFKVSVVNTQKDNRKYK